MPYKIHPKEMANVFGLPSQDRYSHFVNKVVDWEELWILSFPSANPLTLALGDENVEYLPVWPHPEYALAFSEGMDAEIKPKMIGTIDFINKWLPLLNETGVKIGVLPNLDVTVWIVEPLELAEVLQGEYDQLH